jgi:hypothetical protein
MTQQLLGLPSTALDVRQGHDFNKHSGRNRLSLGKNPPQNGMKETGFFVMNRAGRNVFSLHHRNWMDKE